ncbi:hypothetical protein [uncultured Methylobacterium sp.]|uniref:DUF7940 domain-containing protein n=1 Tax=uncultured Methylobacterium sp. TaxID=157278 RepID=UPI0035CC8D16
MTAAVTNLVAVVRHKLSLVPNWRAVLRYGWSIRYSAISLVLCGLEVAFPYLDGVLPVGRGTFGALAGLTTVASMLARVVAQNAVSGAPAATGGDA